MTAYRYSPRPRERSDESATEVRGLKRNLDDERESSELEGDMVPGDHVNGLKMWGYMPGHMHYNLDHSSDADVTSLSPWL